MPQSQTTVKSRWDISAAPSEPLDLLVYASNLLGSDPRITNFGGGNTSTKITKNDPLTGEDVEVLLVKGSGGDLGSAKRQNFASLVQDRVLALEKLGLPEDDIVGLYSHCIFNLNPSAPLNRHAAPCFCSFRRCLAHALRFGDCLGGIRQLRRANQAGIPRRNGLFAVEASRL